MAIYQGDPSQMDTAMIEFQSLDNTTVVPQMANCLAAPPLGTLNPIPLPNEKTDGGVLHVLDGEG